MRYLVILLVVGMAGCRVGEPPKPFEPDPQVYLQQVTQALPQPGPPQPDNNSDKCPNCSGLGWTGDSVIRQTCLMCNGSGKRPATSSSWVPPWPVPEVFAKRELPQLPPPAVTTAAPEDLEIRDETSANFQVEVAPEPEFVIVSGTKNEAGQWEPGTRRRDTAGVIYVLTEDSLWEKL